MSHSKLIEVLSKPLKMDEVYRSSLNIDAGVVEKGVFIKTKLGVPQRGPLLSNIMLNELDKELED